MDLDQLVDAINTVNEEVDINVLNYMCYFVFLRSEDFDNMQYKNLIDLIDSLVETSQSRKQSTTRKNRPESSSPDKLKLRNQTKSNPSTTQGDAKEKDDDEEYSEEEIADDPDQEGDS